MFTLARDPDDEPYLNLAIAVSADYLVTRDNDMLDLMHDAAFAAQFLSRAESAPSPQRSYLEAGPGREAGITSSAASAIMNGRENEVARIKVGNLNSSRDYRYGYILSRLK